MSVFVYGWRTERQEWLRYVLFTWANRSLCTLLTWACFSFNACRHLFRGYVMSRPSSWAWEEPRRLGSSMEASIWRMVVIMSWASWMICFFSWVTRRTWLFSASDRAANSCVRVGTPVSLPVYQVYQVTRKQCRAREVSWMVGDVSHTSASLDSRSWLGTPISSKRPCNWPIMELTCWER